MRIASAPKTHMPEPSVYGEIQGGALMKAIHFHRTGDPEVLHLEEV